MVQADVSWESAATFHGSLPLIFCDTPLSIEEANDVYEVTAQASSSRPVPFCRDTTRSTVHR